MPGKLILLPNLLDESQETNEILPLSVNSAVTKILGLIGESEKIARRYLRRFISREKMDLVPIRLLSEHTSLEELNELTIPLLKGETWGLISDAGLPCIADPGSLLVAKAHELGIEVTALPGPCSIVLALELSGFSGQRFSFQGYLPKEEALLEKTIRDLEKRSCGETQIWIETPYRTQKMLDKLKETLQPDTSLCIAANLTLPTQKCISQKISKWKVSNIHFEKEPAIFLLYRH